MSDRELLELAAKAMAEHEAWKVRNAARKAYRGFLRAYLDETGTWFDRDYLVRYEEMEDVAKFDALKAAAISTQRALAACRAATRRAVVRAAAEIEKALP